MLQVKVSGAFMYAELLDWLKQSARLCRHRRVLLLRGSRGWQVSLLKAISREVYRESLWIGEKIDFMPSVLYVKAKQLLGQEKDCIVFDASHDLHVDALAVSSGLVKGGGAFILLLPGKENAAAQSLFRHRFLEKLQHFSNAIVIDQGNPPDKLPMLAEATANEARPVYAHGCITEDQAVAVKAILDNYQEKKLPLVLQADRGRGKSAALGIAAAQLVRNGCKRIIVTAPARKTADIIFKHAAASLDKAEIKQAKILNEHGGIYFYAPDEIIREGITGDILLVDEAAAIPVPILTELLNRFKPCLFATTVHGYEGTGRGFHLRFKSVLDKNMPSWQELVLTEPVRWADNDPLEKWLFDLLLLDADIADIATVDAQPECEYSRITQQQLADNETLLKEIFSLLVIAHYRTRPSDLKQLLDERKLNIYLARIKGHVVAVSLLAHEGGFDRSLCRAIYRGQRRPQGHLLAQALTYHCGIEDAASENYARVMRIAVHPQLQSRGIGSGLLQYVINQQQQSAVSAIGTSFGLNAELLRFWQRAGFAVVRTGFKREKTSGEHAAIMLRALNSSGQKIFTLARSRFIVQAPYWFCDVLSDLPDELQSQLLEEPDPLGEVEIDWQKDIDSYIHYSRNFELCIAALHRLVLKQQQVIRAPDFPDNFRQMLLLKVIDRFSWKDLVKKLHLSGQKEARQLFHQAVVYLLQDTESGKYL